MNRTREILNPSDAMKFLIATLNNPSIQHERIEMKDLYIATAEALEGKTHRPITLTKSGVVIEGLAAVLASVHAWKPISVDVAKNAKGTRAYERKGPRRAHTADELQETIEKEIAAGVRHLRLGSA